jgi:electron-transferring-flavoprotein dehydrogenase
VVRPADYPPAWQDAEAIAEPAQDEEAIDVGVLIVGAGPAGLAAAIRLGQLAAGDPATAERLGEVPVAVLEKGKGPGSHLLSGAVINPKPLYSLLSGLREPGDVPTYGKVPGESVLMLTPTRALPVPPPPTMRNHGNVIVSVSALGRWLGEVAEETGSMILPETSGQQLLVEAGKVIGVRTGDKGRGRDGEPLGRFEPGSDIRAQVTILAEGTQGHLTGAAIDRFRLAGDSAQTWALGVKEVWKVPKPLRKIIHTMGWPLRSGAKYREFGGSFIYPMGDDMLTIGLVVGLDYTDSALSVHDLLQELKTHPRIRPLLEGGERVAWGAKTIPEGGYVAVPQKLWAPGVLITGDGAGLVNVPALKGIHYAVESGRLAAEAAWRAVSPEGRSGWLPGYDEELRSSFVWRDLRKVRNMRQGFAHGFWRGAALAGIETATFGRTLLADKPTHRDASHALMTTSRAVSYPVPDGVLTFDKLSSVFLSGNRTRDDQPNHVRIQTRVPEVLGRMWERMCPAAVYETESADDGLVNVKIAPSNCVQCGAITAKGGRLTPPEGGSGPEYTLT